MQKFIDIISDYLNQSGSSWFTMSQAMDYNLVTISMYMTGCVILCLSFYTIDLLLAVSIRKQGFFSSEHKTLALWFMLFLFLCGTAFGIQILAFFQPVYWIISGFLFLASLSALFTAILYIKYFKVLSNAPNPKRVIELEIENIHLKKKSKLLREQLDTWPKDVGYHIDVLKEEYSKLSKEVHNFPSAASEVVSKSAKNSYQNEEVRQELLDTLNKLKDDISVLTASMKS